jgi:hypothetical protein
VGSKYDLTQRAAASAAASYLECGNSLPVFRPFDVAKQGTLSQPGLAQKKRAIPFRSYVNS